ncbi:Hypothetical predicted protein [Mytilus galloprovincialis]|uniref:Tesmin/TSO1-like CXC domain-containing protein n=1 Tax=Mytilus galloprovincialis TaxID=29158 RepID=A0A8B6DPF6_MYTGA|nr:Hypothetical predicted protein [Mytilus galloprovincialis]
MQATRPRSLIAPLQLGLGVQMHHHFGSKFLLDTLYQLGFSSSYKEVQKHGVNSALQGDDSPQDLEGRCIQHVADNVDHNIRTLDGHGTFHGMGIIAGITPGYNHKTIVQRLNVSLDDIKQIGKIDLHQYNFDRTSKLSLKFESLAAQQSGALPDNISLLCSTLWPKKRIGWSAMCNLVQDGAYPGKSTIVFLPMIDLEPGNLSCIFSTMKFVCNEAFKYRANPMLTFDQPLYWKALTIIDNEPKDSDLKSIVLRLGGFHLEMSFLGSIGNIMSGSGLAELMETVYAPNAVTHMFTGKAVARAVRGHFLIYNALTSLLLCEHFHVSSTVLKDHDTENVEHLSSLEDSEIHNENTFIQDLNKLSYIFDEILERHLPVDTLDQNEVLRKIRDSISTFRKSHIENRTARLWFLYMDMVDLLRNFIKAERTGNWTLHLQTIQKMLPYFAAAGHNLYLKSAYVYLQQMHGLSRTNPAINEALMSGFHVMRRSDRFWSGLSSDLIIEQVLMRCIKTTGGLTRGRGMTDAQRSLWILSMPQCIQMNEAMQQVTGVNFETSEQHKEMCIPRKVRDTKDTTTFLDFLGERSPFSIDKNLRNIETGATGDSNVNSDNALVIGHNIISSMEGKCIDEFVFKRKNQVTTLSSKLNIKVDNEEISVDPQLLFQRLVTTANTMFPDVSQVFKYELSAVPAALFEPSGLMRQAQKSTLADEIWNTGSCVFSDDLGTDVRHVIDGGSLIQRIPWKKGATFAEICQLYIDHINNRYPIPIIVFDGYGSGPTTKDHVHERRSKGVTGTHISFKDSTPFKSKKEIFLANGENKQNFINMLCNKMDNEGFISLQAAADADVLIASTAVRYASCYPTVVVGEDTDVLILLLFHAEENSKPLVFQSDKIRKSKVWDIKKTKELLGNEIVDLLPFIHAITGCDTTSRLYGIGKKEGLKRLRENAFFRELASVFLKQDATSDDVIQSGQSALVILYGGETGESLDQLRYRKFNHKVLTNSLSCVHVQSLPPTSEAASQHCKRAYYQIQEWTNDSVHMLSPSDWGWVLQGTSLCPIRTILPPAPDNLLHVIRCKCKSGCDTRRCTCRKNGLDCSSACSECKGLNCSNCKVLEIHEDEDDSDI